jgi:hypothetical protein
MSKNYALINPIVRPIQEIRGLPNGTAFAMYRELTTLPANRYNVKLCETTDKTFAAKPLGIFVLTGNLPADFGIKARDIVTNRLIKIRFLNIDPPNPVGTYKNCFFEVI